MIENPMLTIVPIEFDEACQFVKQHHRHHQPPVRVKFSIACAADDRICGVAMIGRPVSRHNQDGWTLEIVRLCTDGTQHAASKLAPRAWRIVQAMGYRRLITYILEDETGVSLITAGMRCVGKTTGGSWDRKERPRVDKHPTQPKLRFEYYAEPFAVNVE